MRTNDRVWVNDKRVCCLGDELSLFILIAGAVVYFLFKWGRKNIYRDFFGSDGFFIVIISFLIQFEQKYLYQLLLLFNFISVYLK